MKQKKSCSGFTVVELMVAMLAMAVLALVVGLMLFYGWLGWRDQSESVAMQRDAMVAMRIMEKEIRISSIDEIGADGNGIYFDASPEVGRDSAVAFLASDIAYSGGVVLDSWTDPEFDMTTVAGATGVVIRFSLSNSRGTDENEYRMTAYPRN